MVQILCSSALLLLCFSCTYYNHEFPYDFDQTSASIKLPEELAEISGLAHKSQDLLFAIQDEEGKIYEVDYNNENYKLLIDFKSKGDFEGIAFLGPFFYVLKSDGDIYMVDFDGKYKKFTFPDNKGFDFEGVTVHSNKKSLIVACKRHGVKKKNKFIWLFSFDLESKKYMETPFLKYKKEAIHEKFQPSGIAFSPNGNMYLISAKSFTIAEFDTSKKLVRTAQLPFLRYPQVEGICFASSGSLYISSEKGDQPRGRIIKLNRRR